MTVEEILEQIRSLSPEDKAHLMKALGPEMCSSLMNSPQVMAEMMPRFREWMQDPAIQRTMSAMMRQMMQTMMTGEERNG